MLAAMRGYMFRNRWGALLFVGLVLAAVTQLVGTGKGDGALAKATQDLVRQRAATASLTDRVNASAGRAAKVQFASDEELIDPAQGEDPTPIDQREKPAGDADEVPHDTVILIRDPAARPEQELRR